MVSTRVGGVPEVLPDEFITLEEPVPDGKFELLVLKYINKFADLVAALMRAIEWRETGLLMNPIERHRRVSHMYYWPDVSFFFFFL